MGKILFFIALVVVGFVAWVVLNPAGPPEEKIVDLYHYFEDSNETNFLPWADGVCCHCVDTRTKGEKYCRAYWVTAEKCASTSVSLRFNWVLCNWAEDSSREECQTEALCK